MALDFPFVRRQPNIPPTNPNSDRFLSEAPSPTTVNPQLDQGVLSANAVAVVTALREAGFEAYLVGGCVRDMLLGRTPKDFDVATDATPEEVKGVFPRARLVGRRFRIAHVQFRGEYIEVSTFRRGNPDEDDDDDVASGENHRSVDGVILRDNLYGTRDEDALRRDFTVNAFYYDPIDDVLLDYSDGLRDIGERTLRTIGDPKTRFREDPVRILRAMRFASKLDFGLHADAQEAIAPLAELLTAISPSRLFDEFNKLFMRGHAVAAWTLMCKFDLPEILFPLFENDEALVRVALKNTDDRIREDKRVTSAFLFAAMCWPEFQRRSALSATSRNAADERLKAAHAVISEQSLTIAIPRRMTFFIRDVWRLQTRLERKTARGILDHPRFRAAYDFLAIRAEVGEADTELVQWWTDAQEARGTDENAPASQPRRRRRRRHRGRRSDARQVRP